MKKLVFAAAVVSVLSVQAKVIGHWRFTGTPGETAAVGTQFPNLVEGTGVGAAEIFCYGENESYLPVFGTGLDTPWTLTQNGLTGSVVRADIAHSTIMLRSDARYSNNRWLYDKDSTYGYPIRVPDPNGKMKCKTFTIEWIARMTTHGTGRAVLSMACKPVGEATASQHSIYVQSTQGSTWSGKLSVENAGVKTYEGTFVGNNNNAVSVDSETFHHFALVVNGETKQAALYRDYEIYRGGFRGISDNAKAYNIDMLYEDKTAPLVFGGSTIAPRCAYVEFAEARYSDEVLKPAQFLRKALPGGDGTTLFYLTSESNFVSAVNAEMLAPVLTTNNLLGAEYPSVVSNGLAGAQARLLDKSAVLHDNFGALHSASGQLYYSRARFLPSEKAMTIEFYLRLPNGMPASSSVVSTRDSGGNETDTYGWAFAASTANCPKFVFKTLAQGGYYEAAFNAADSATVCDGNWHHIAVTVEKLLDTDQTRVKLYLDHNATPCADTTVSGLFREMTNTRPDFNFGRVKPYSKSGDWVYKTPFSFELDEFRVSRGVLPVEKFVKLGRKPRGLVIVVR